MLRRISTLITILFFCIAVVSSFSPQQGYAVTCCGIPDCGSCGPDWDACGCNPGCTGCCCACCDCCCAGGDGGGDTGEVCGNGSCGTGEDCANCCSDCGSCCGTCITCNCWGGGVAYWETNFGNQVRLADAQLTDEETNQKKEMMQSENGSLCMVSSAYAQSSGESGIQAENVYSYYPYKSFLASLTSAEFHRNFIKSIAGQPAIIALGVISVLSLLIIRKRHRKYSHQS